MNENTISCAFCGKTFPFPDNVGRPDRVTTTPELREHIKVCKQHPLHEALERIERLKARVEALLNQEPPYTNTVGNVGVPQGRLNPRKEPRP